MQLRQDLATLGLLDKAHDIHRDLGDRAVISYIRSSFRLLSKVYHPDVNPANARRAELMQVTLNRVNEDVSAMSDEDLVAFVGFGTRKRGSGKERILVVEDEVGMHRALRRVLGMEGYEVDIALNGLMGYKRYEVFQPDLVLTDVIMPEWDGLEMVGKIRDLNPKIKVIYMTGFADFASLKDDMEHEAECYGYEILAKPFKASTLLNAVNRMLAHEASISNGLDMYA